MGCAPMQKNLVSIETESGSVSLKLDTLTETLRVPQTQSGIINDLLLICQYQAF